MTTHAEEKIPDKANFPKGEAVWTVTMHYAHLDKEKEKDTTAQEAPDTAPEQETQRHIDKVSILRGRDFRRDRVGWSDGTTTDFWWSRKARIVLYRVKPDEPIRKTRSSGMGVRRYDQQLFDWVSRKNFVRKDKLQNEEYAYYETNSVIQDTGGEKEVHGAWLSLEDGTPAAYRIGDVVYFFKFGDPSLAANVVLPPDFREELEFYEAYISKPKRLGQKRPEQKR